MAPEVLATWCLAMCRELIVPAVLYSVATTPRQPRLSYLHRAFSRAGHTGMALRVTPRNRIDCYDPVVSRWWFVLRDDRLDADITWRGRSRFPRSFVLAAFWVNAAAKWPTGC